MKAAGKSLELFRYDAEHGFGNEQRCRCMTGSPRNWPGAARRSFSGSIWGEGAAFRHVVPANAGTHCD